MRGILVEGGVYFLLLFAPLAFGAVEGWALGVIEAVAALLLILWAWSPPGAGSRREAGASGDALARPLRVLWGAIAAFVALTLVQMVPLPPGAIRAVSPRTDELYARTIPGYAGAGPAAAADLPAWLVARTESSVAAAAGTKGPAPDPPEGPGAPAPSVPKWRTLSVYPFATRQKLELLLSLIAVFAVVLGHFRTNERLSRLLSVVVFCGFAVSLLGILQKFDWNGKLYWIREGEYGNPFGPFVDRNTYAAFAGTTLPIAIGLTFGARRQMARGAMDALPQLLFSAFAAVTTAGGIFYSLSRGGMVSTTISIVIIAALLLYYGRQNREIAILALIVVLATGFLLWIGPETVLHRIGTLQGAHATPSLAGRVDAWTHAMRLIADHPAAGTGLGTFAFAFLRYAPPGGEWWNVAHNEYIELVCDTGAPGAALALVGFGAWLLIVARPRLFRELDSRYAYAGLVAGIAALLLHSCVTSNLQVPANSVLLVVLGAALMRLVGREADRAADGEAVDAPRRRSRRKVPA